MFVPVNAEYLKTLGAEWRATASRELLWHHFMREWEDPAQADHEPVVLMRVLRHPVNSQMVVFPGGVLGTVNGKPINNLKDVADALDQNNGRFDVFVFETSNTTEALDREKARAAGPVILKTYGIPKDRNL